MLDPIQPANGPRGVQWQGLVAQRLRPGSEWLRGSGQESDFGSCQLRSESVPVRSSGLPVLCVGRLLVAAIGARPIAGAGVVPPGSGWFPVLAADSQVGPDSSVVRRSGGRLVTRCSTIRYQSRPQSCQPLLWLRAQSHPLGEPLREACSVRRHSPLLCPLHGRGSCRMSLVGPLVWVPASPLPGSAVGGQMAGV